MAAVTTSNKEVQEFMRLDKNSRLRKAMQLGDTGLPQHLPVLSHAVLNDPELNVRFAVLKRIHLFKGQADVEFIIDELQKNEEQLEPYYSMALSRLGLISEADLIHRLNIS